MGKTWGIPHYFVKNDGIQTLGNNKSLRDHYVNYVPFQYGEILLPNFFQNLPKFDHVGVQTWLNLNE